MLGGIDARKPIIAGHAHLRIKGPVWNQQMGYQSRFFGMAFGTGKCRKGIEISNTPKGPGTKTSLHVHTTQ